jgi:hypothetical protein
MKTEHIINQLEVNKAYRNILWRYFIYDGLRLIGAILVGIFIYSFF